MKKPTATKTETIHIRLSQETRQMLEEIAELESRTMTNAIEWLIKKEYEKRKG